MASSQKRPRPFNTNEGAPISNIDIHNKFLVIQSTEVDKPITALSPFVIEKEVAAKIGTPKTVKKLRNQTLLIETTKKSQTEVLMNLTTFHNLNVTVSEHKTLNSSKGIIKDRILKDLTEEEITENLQNQGVIGCKRFKIKKDGKLIETNTLLLTFNSPTIPKTLGIFYRFIPVELYIPNPLRCFNCQKFGHHESNCKTEENSVCEKCGAGNFAHHSAHCPNTPKCVNCGKNHLSRSNQCEVWKKEKEILKLKVTKNISYLEAKKKCMN